MLDLVGNPEDRFSQNEANLFSFSFSYHLIPGDSYLHTSSKYVTYRSLE